ncbi:hypothetical protein BDV95DRAFT_612584 [Massariosphaeria phaeospora]|uniref:FAD-binding domain-containing protein n=1 Tax=Massariosphaeria phaeospora TaxID=100035 RepID=A0A7C8M1P4_9PLEO|nr:hypothetical protein BDV95DRAFT_612584 [Massariosphaeria phaeospora]
MAQKPLEILISGAGVAGSSLALVASRFASFTPKPRITLLERSPRPRTTGQAVDIRGPGVQVIRRLGLESAIKERHTTETGLEIVDSNGGTIARFDMSGDAENQSATSEYEILRGELAGLLLEQLEEAVPEGQQPHVRLVCGEIIRSLEEQDDGVTVEFTNGKLEAQKFDVVIAADGAYSTTRSLIFGDAVTQECVKPSGMYIAYFTVPRVEQDSDLWCWYHTEGGLAVHLRPHRTKKTMGVYLSITNAKKERVPELEEVLSQGVAAQKTFLRDRFRDVGWQSARFLDAMDGADDLYMQNVALVKTQTYVHGRCALLGDSAHCTMGVGTSLAMAGAYVIAGELAKAPSHDSADIVAALKRYEDVFKPYVDKEQGTPEAFSPFPQWANPQTKLGVGLLRTVLRFAYWTNVAKILGGLAGWSKEGWQLPEYGW